MTKQQTVELLQKQLPGFYSVEQVIKIINDIEDGQSFDGEQIDDLVETIREKVENRLRRLDSSDIVEFDTAEFELNGNEISLYTVDVASVSIADEAAIAAEEAIKEFFKTPQEAV